jgi:hypothetical protein
MNDVESRPIIVCLCGSTRFKDAFVDASRSETLAGRIVLSVGLFGHRGSLDMGGPVKAMLDALHLEKCRLADEILVINEDDYVGHSTANEIAFSRSIGKRIRWLVWPSRHAQPGDEGANRCSIGATAASPASGSS